MQAQVKCFIIKARYNNSVAVFSTDGSHSENIFDAKRYLPDTDGRQKLMMRYNNLRDSKQYSKIEIVEADLNINTRQPLDEGVNNAIIKQAIARLDPQEIELLDLTHLVSKFIIEE